MRLISIVTGPVRCDGARRRTGNDGDGGHGGVTVYFHGVGDRVFRAPADNLAKRTRLAVPAAGKGGSVGSVVPSPDGRWVAEVWSGVPRQAQPARHPGHRHGPRRSACERAVWSRTDTVARGEGVRWGVPALSWASRVGAGFRLYFSATRVVDDHASNESTSPSRLLFSVISAKHRPTTPQGVPGGNGLSYPAVDPTDGSLAAVRLDASTGTCWTGSASSTTSTIVLIDPRSGVSEDLLTVTAPPATCSFGIRQPAWSPDGAQIAFQQQSCCVGPNLYQGEIDAVAADGSDGDTYRVAVPATARYLVSSPTWRNAHSLWFQREIQDDGAEDNGLRTKPALFAVRSQEDRFGSRLVRRTDTPRVWEISPSFG